MEVQLLKDELERLVDADVPAAEWMQDLHSWCLRGEWNKVATTFGRDWVEFLQGKLRNGRAEFEEDFQTLITGLRDSFLTDCMHRLASLTRLNFPSQPNIRSEEFHRKFDKYDANATGGIRP